VSRVRLLFDENIPALLPRAVRRRAPGHDTLRVGGEGAPELGSTDDLLLTWCETQDRLLVTLDRSTIPKHLARHLAAGHHSPGVLVLRPKEPLGRVVEALVLILEASHPDEWRDRIWYVPL
jgi:hypothetical protein